MDETDKKIRELTEAMRAEQDARIRNRMMAVRGILAGYPTKDAAYFADVDRRTVQLWVARFDESGIGGLRDAPGRGRPPRAGYGRIRKLGLCPTDIYSLKIVRHNDPMIAVRLNEKIKRDQRPYELVQQHLSGLIMNTILKIVEDLGDPYQAKPGLGGMTAYPPKAMAVVCIMMEAEMKTYRKMVGYLRMHPDLVSRIGLPKIPSKSTIWCAYGMIPEPYLREVHTRIIGDVMVTGSLAGDQHRLLQQQVRPVVQHPPRPGQAQARLGQAAQHRRCLHQDRPRLPGHRRVHLRHHRIVADAGKDRRRRRLLLPGLGLPGQEDLRHRIRQGHDTAHPAPSPIPSARTGAVRPGAI